MKSANSSNRPAAAARAARTRLLLAAPLCLAALLGALLAGGPSRAAAVAQDAAPKAQGVEASGKGAAPARASQSGGKAKPAVAKSGGAQPLADQIGCVTNPSPITLNGGTVSGTLSSTDCRHPFDNSFYDAYTFTAQAGQLVIIELTSAAFDPYLYLLRPGETTLSYRSIQHDDINLANNNLNSRLVGVLPGTGNTTYTILANSANVGETGAYQLSVRSIGNCAATNLGSATTTVNGSLASGDCQLHDNSFVDVYAFTAAAGQQVSVALSSSAFDSFLFLLSTDGFTELARNDDGLSGGGNDNSARGARIPAPDTGQGAGLATLPASGTYYVLANSFSTGETGNYSLTLTLGANCPTQAIASGQTVSGSLATTDCRLPFDGSFIDVYTFQGTAGQQISVTMTADSPLDAYLLLYDPDGFLLDEDNNGAGGTNARIPASSGTITLPFTGTYRIYANAAAPGQTGAYQLSVSPTSAPACAVSLSPAVTPFTQGGGAGRFTVVPNDTSQQCSWAATTTATWIAINTGATGTGISRVTYTVAANNTGATRTGTITVNGQTHTVTQTGPTPPTVAFKFANYSVSEADASRSITVAVSRLGDTAGASTVEYRTVFTAQEPVTPCNPTQTQARGTAFGRCDFATTVDTLTFLPGEAEKTFTIPLVNDVHVEGAETFQIELTDPRGATLGTTQATATVTINDDDTAQPTVNPVRPPLPYGADTPRFFVRMQYLDFLSREPESGEPWTGVLVRCANPENGAHDTNTPSAGCDRIIVSKSFFESPEFRLKGFFVFLYHKVSFGSAQNPNYFPEYPDIVTDMRRVTGATGPETIARRLDFAEDWLARPAFTARYNGLSNADFVNTLLANVNVTLTQAGSGFTAASLIADLNAGTKTRAEVLRLIVESPEVSARQFNHAYVAMQYYGYLRRTPDLNGYLAWLNAINQNSQNLRVMVDGFMNSTEYVFRFGPN